ncbi:hypothetical protein NQ315_002187 [Exocentrus adspersus]|uniref:Uncharacterized protein n=1 Tax=Exocentrus adspersus TaxID=1586481 RepID=A0AAV8W0K4_9CUCU|nr:hypothetical protein NQ315_002187 [Exocentrus adspersus]
MECPFDQYYDDQEYSEDSYSEEDFRPPEKYSQTCCKCLVKRNNFDSSYTRCPQQENPADCLCFKEKPKVKGKFGLAYIVQTPNDRSCKPLGWQVEFQDTPSQIDRNCQKMVNWVTCPPLGECSSNVEAVLCYPETCNKLLKSAETKKCCCVKKPVADKCCVVEVPKQVQENCCVCQTCCKKERKRTCACSHKEEQIQKCVCVSKNKRYCLCSNTNSSSGYFGKQYEKFMVCKKCCKTVMKCTCGQPVRNCCYCEKKKLKCKCQLPCKSSEKGICEHCQKSKSYYCTFEEHICPGCGKVMEKKCYVKENCVCEPYGDVLDYIPRRDVSSKSTNEEVKQRGAQVKSKEPSKVETNVNKTASGVKANKTETAVKKDKAPLEVKNKEDKTETVVKQEKTPSGDVKAPKPVDKATVAPKSSPVVENKTAPNIAPLVENKTPVENKASPQPPAVTNQQVHKDAKTIKKESKERAKDEVSRIKVKEEPKSDHQIKLESKMEVMNLTKEFDDEVEVKVVDLEGEPEPKPAKTFTTKGNDPNQPSLLERIKKAHHKQIHEIHPDIPLELGVRKEVKPEPKIEGIVKEEPKSDGDELEVKVEDLGGERESAKTFTTKGSDPNQPSLLERIKKAHHKQVNEIHAEMPL